VHTGSVPFDSQDEVVRPSVSLLYRHRAPSHYVARLGVGGWCEGWGWSAGDAIADLARAISDERPVDVPVQVLASPIELLTWLGDRTSTAVLDDT
jgi:hypothetical protein